MEGSIRTLEKIEILLPKREHALKLMELPAETVS
jgi:hypothetical protein